MSYHADVFTIRVKGDRATVIRMLNAAILNAGEGNVILGDDALETINCKLKKRGYDLYVCVSDFLDGDCLADSVIREKKAAYEAQADDCGIDRDLDIEDVREVAEGLEIVLSSVFVDDDGFTEHHPDWAELGDIARLYDCEVVSGWQEYGPADYPVAAGTATYGHVDGSLKVTKTEVSRDLDDEMPF